MTAAYASNLASSVIVARRRTLLGTDSFLRTCILCCYGVFLSICLASSVAMKLIIISSYCPLLLGHLSLKVFSPSVLLLLGCRWNFTTINYICAVCLLLPMFYLVLLYNMQEPLPKKGYAIIGRFITYIKVYIKHTFSKYMGKKYYHMDCVWKLLALASWAKKYWHVGHEWNILTHGSCIKVKKGGTR